MVLDRCTRCKRSLLDILIRISMLLLMILIPIRILHVRHKLQIVNLTMYAGSQEFLLVIQDIILHYIEDTRLLLRFRLLGGTHLLP
jgi:hypothetical protein